MAMVKVLKPRRNVNPRTGRPTVQPARRTAAYYQWGVSRCATQARGAWYGPQGAQTWEQVNDWIAEQSAVHPYTYTLILSTAEGVELDAPAWQRVMASQGQFADWRVIGHADTNNRHAHVLLFADHAYGGRQDKLLPRQQFMPWWQGLRQQIHYEELQAQREQETGAERSREPEAPVRARQAQIELE